MKEKKKDPTNREYEKLNMGNVYHWRDGSIKDWLPSSRTNGTTTGSIQAARGKAAELATVDCNNERPTCFCFCFCFCFLLLPLFLLLFLSIYALFTPRDGEHKKKIIKKNKKNR